MIQIVMKPERAPIVKREGLYGVWMNGNLIFRVRARNAKHAEEKVMFLMERETRGKTIDFDLDRFADEFRRFRKFWAEKILQKKEKNDGKED